MYNHNKLYVCSLVIAIVFLASSVSFAGLSPKTVGLGDSFSTITGVDALAGNPAAVNAGDKVFTLEISGGAKAWNNLLSNDYIKQSKKDKLLDQISESGFILRPAGRAGARLMIGPVTTAVDLRAAGITSLSTDLAEVMLKGNEIGETYSLDDSVGAGGVYGDASVNVSLLGLREVPLPGLKQDLQNLYVGFTYHQLLGGVISKLDGTGSTTLGYNEQGEFSFEGNGRFTVKYNKPESLAQTATGSAIDIGGYAQLNDTYSIGFSALNIGSLSTSGESTYYRKYKVSYEGKSQPTVTETSGEKPLNEPITWQLPTTYRVGGKINAGESLDFFADYSYTEYHPGGEAIVEHKVGAAVEATWLNFLPLRTGINYSTLRNDLAWAGGLGLYLGPLKTEIGVSDLLGFTCNSRQVKAAVNLQIEF